MKKQEVFWYPFSNLLKSKEEIIPPEGSLKTFKEGNYHYNRITKLRLSNVNQPSKIIWVAVDCEGNPNNNKSIVFSENEIPICELCKNQLFCKFKDINTKTDKAILFSLLEEYEGFERESFNYWVSQNEKKYKIRIPNV